MKPNIRLFLKDFGLISQTKIRNVFVNTVRIYLGKDDVTFKELQEARPDMPRLYISAYCVNLEKTEYFSSLTTPDMSVLDAICMTIAVPFLFASIEKNGRRYIDGGILEETPAGPFLGKNDVKVLRCIFPPKHIETHNLKSYIMSFFTLTMNLRHRYAFPSIDVDMRNFDPFNFGMSTETKLKLFSLGYSSTQKQAWTP